jgi:hypothetical protein
MGHLSTRSAGAMYRFRFFAAATAEGRIALAAECRRRLPRSEHPKGPATPAGELPTWQQFFETADIPNTKDFSDETIGRAIEGRNWVLLAKIAGKSISFETAKMQNPSVEQWCREALKKFAAAIVEAERR